MGFLRSGGTGPEKNILVRFPGSVGNGGHIPQINRSAAVQTDNDTRHIRFGFQKTTHMNPDLSLPGGIVPGIALLIGGTDHYGHPVDIQTESGQAHRVQVDIHLAGIAADQGGDGHVFFTLDQGLHLRGETPELVSVQIVIFRPKSKGQNRDVINISRFDQRRCGRPGNPVHIGHELGLKPNDGFLLILAHIEPDDGHGCPRAGCGIHILHTGDLPQQLFHGIGDPFFDFPSAGTGHFDEDIHHGNDNLRLFFPGKRDDRGNSHQNGGNDDQRGELGIDEKLRDSAGRA